MRPSRGALARESPSLSDLVVVVVVAVLLVGLEAVDVVHERVEVVHRVVQRSGARQPAAIANDGSDTIGMRPTFESDKWKACPDAPNDMAKLKKRKCAHWFTSRRDGESAISNQEKKSSNPRRCCRKSLWAGGGHGRRGQKNMTSGCGPRNMATAVTPRGAFWRRRRTARVLRC